MRILLVEDQGLFRQGLKRLLEAEPCLRVTGEAGRAEEALERLEQSSFDLLMTDLSLPDRDGLWLVRRVAQDHPDLPVVVVSMHQDPRTVQRTLQAGARGYLLKTATAEQLLQAVHCAARGETYLQPELDPKAPLPPDPLPTLSLAEVEVLHFARRGLLPEEVRQRLSLSEPTFQSRVRSICRRLGVDDLTAAVERALEARVLIADEHQ